MIHKIKRVRCVSYVRQTYVLNPSDLYFDQYGKCNRRLQFRPINPYKKLLDLFEYFSSFKKLFDFIVVSRWSTIHIAKTVGRWIRGLLTFFAVSSGAKFRVTVLHDERQAQCHVRVPGQHLPVTDGRGGVQRGGQTKRRGRQVARGERRHWRMARGLLARRSDDGRAQRQRYTFRALRAATGQGTLQ